VWIIAIPDSMNWATLTLIPTPHRAAEATDSSPRRFEMSLRSGVVQGGFMMVRHFQ
jgi:hypothetical protein